MAEAKTKPTRSSVTTFLNAIADKQRREDCFAIAELMASVTNAEATMWGAAIVGFGSYHYIYESGREGDAPLVAFSPRKANISLYVHGAVESQGALFATLGKHKLGKGCLYIDKLSDVDAKVLKQIVTLGVDYMKKKYPAK